MFVFFFWAKRERIRLREKKQRRVIWMKLVNFEFSNSNQRVAAVRELPKCLFCPRRDFNFGLRGGNVNRKVLNWKLFSSIVHVNCFLLLKWKNLRMALISVGCRQTKHCCSQWLELIYSSVKWVLKAPGSTVSPDDKGLIARKRSPTSSLQSKLNSPLSSTAIIAITSSYVH